MLGLNLLLWMAWQRRINKFRFHYHKILIISWWHIWSCTTHRTIVKGGDVWCSHFLFFPHTFQEVSIYGAFIYQLLDEVLHYKAISKCVTKDAMVVAEVWFIKLANLSGLFGLGSSMRFSSRRPMKRSSTSSAGKEYFWFWRSLREDLLGADEPPWFWFLIEGPPVWYFWRATVVSIACICFGL